MEYPKFKTKVNTQLPPEELRRDVLRRGEGILAVNGALCIRTGKFTGRSPEDKFIVRDQVSEALVDWNLFNHPIEENYFLGLREKICAYLDARPEIWSRDACACADARFRLSVRIVTEQPAANLFAANLFMGAEAAGQPEWLLLHAPGYHAAPRADGTRNANFTILSFRHKTILIGGSGYTGEIKKSIFTLLNFILPQSGVLPMHCSANEGAPGGTALFFGLSGTGKTTLSATGARKLVGDDEHGWSDNGIFNMEAGCYAKIINLSRACEPEIFQAIRSGALVENAVLDGGGSIDFNDRSVTENTRASYPLHFIANAKIPAVSVHPGHIFFLSCDAHGVLPPISRLNETQAMYYFLNGYTAKVAGTEEGVSEPKTTFSACFGAPFLPLHPECYAALLARKIKAHRVKVWLINTGWTAGPYGKGYRISIAHTRAMIAAALAGRLDGAVYRVHPVFGLDVPQSCPGVPVRLLNPRDMWGDKAGYDSAAVKLAALFDENFAGYGSLAL